VEPVGRYGHRQADQPDDQVEEVVPAVDVPSPRNELWCVESKWASAKKPAMPTRVSNPPNTIAYPRAQFWVSLGVGW